MYTQSSVSSPVDSLIHIRVVEYNVQTLVSKFQRNGLQIALRRSLHDLATDEGVACERDLVDGHVLADGLPGGVSVACDVDDAERESYFVDQGSHPDGSQGREF